jgi:cytochrome c5
MLKLVYTLCSLLTIVQGRHYYQLGGSEMIRIFSVVVAGSLMFIAGNASAAFDAKAGKSIYDSSCTSCHQSGLMGAPIVGNKGVWAPRISKGMNVLVSESIKGYQSAKGRMPAKGGNPDLSDAQVGNAVAYMISVSK